MYIALPADMVYQTERRIAYQERERMRDHHAAERVRGDRPAIPESEKEFIFLGRRRAARHCVFSVR